MKTVLKASLPRKRVASGTASGVKTLTNQNMRITNQRNMIPDRSRPGLTTAATGAVPQQGACGNYATVGQRKQRRQRRNGRRRKRGGRRARKQMEKRRMVVVTLRIGTSNVGSMTGRGREVAAMMEKRQLDILCVQETKWKGSKAKDLGGGYKLYYHGCERNKNGIGIILSASLTEDVEEVKRISDRIMQMKIDYKGCMLNIISAYAPQTGCDEEEKDRFWEEMDNTMVSIPIEERVVIGADLNGHVGEGNTGCEDVMGIHGFGNRNAGGERIVEFASRTSMAVLNTYFTKKDEHKITYKSGGRRTQIDYMLCRRRALKNVADCKTLVGEHVTNQHRIVVCKIQLETRPKRPVPVEPRIRWWKLTEDCAKKDFKRKVEQNLGQTLPEDWKKTTTVIKEIAKSVLGVSSGRRKVDKDTWWWNPEVQICIQSKKQAKQEWDRAQDERSKVAYRIACRTAKKAVARAKAEAYNSLYEHLNTKEGEKEAYRIAKQRDKASQDVQHVRNIRDADDNLLTSEEDILDRWKGYFERLMNEEHPREMRTQFAMINVQAVQGISKDEVRKSMQGMKNGKALGPDGIPAEVWKCLGESAVEFLASLFNRILDGEPMPDDWRKSIIIPIYKNKGDAHQCGNYRGVKLTSHTMKIWERVIEARLRRDIEIGDQQYGFMPGRSTMDAIFGLRILGEKYREGQKELHSVFIDLEKAYDRVPREEMWHCLRSAGVAETYVRVIQDMYDDSETMVRCSVGTTKSFSVKVGLHQGSALSPFLFTVVMDQLTKKIRREAPWTMMFADDIVLTAECKNQLELDLERWRYALESRGLRISRTKTEYLCGNKKEVRAPIKLQDADVPETDDFKYLGSTIQSNGECGREIKRRIQVGWHSWRKMSGLLCDRRVSARLKGKIHRTVVRPAMMYGLETVALTKRQEAELEVAEMKMLRFELGVTRMDKIRNSFIRGSLHVASIRHKVREARLRWYGHVKRRDMDYVGQRVLKMELPGKRKKGRPKRRYMDALKEDMKAAGVQEMDTQDRMKWRHSIRCGDP